VKKLFIIIPSNRIAKLPPETVLVIEKTHTHTIFVKQNLPPYYLKHPYIHEIISHQKGVSHARNLGIKSALKQKAQILAFTDDDCVITVNWIKNIRTSFENRQTHIVFGQTLPYQPQKHPHRHCPSIFSKTDHRPISWPVSTWNNIGMSNNFAADVHLFNQVGFFNTKIGPGTKIPRGEDDDFIIRNINQGFSVYYNHQMILYHDKWLDPKELNRLYQQCTLGTGYIYSYHALHTNLAYLKIVLKTIVQETVPYFQYLKQIVHPLSFIKLVSEHNAIVYNLLEGFYYSLFNPQA
jgi:GT2 family glycosyltransferase